MKHHTISIPVPRDFAFQSTVVSHGWYRLAPFRWDAGAQTLERTESLPGIGTVDLSIRHEGDLVVEATCSLAAARDALAPRLQRMFQLHLDLGEFLALCRDSPIHSGIAAKRFGRLLCGSTSFEDAVKIILTTNTRWSQTVRMVERIVEHYGNAAPSGHRAFPTAERLAASSAEELADLCRLGYRSRFVHELSQGVQRGEHALEPPPDIPTTGGEALLRFYRRLPGIGPYGAAHLMAMEGRHDFIAVDSEFRRFVSDRYHRGRKVSDRTLLRHYRRWGRWQYLAYWAEAWVDGQ